MAFLNVFIAGGLTCVLFQLILVLGKGKISLPWLLVGGACLGAVLAACGVMDKLVAWGSCGINVMVPVAGSAFYNVTAVVKHGGPAAAVAGVVLLLVWLYVGPCLFGVLLKKRWDKLAAKKGQ